MHVLAGLIMLIPTVRISWMEIMGSHSNLCRLLLVLIIHKTMMTSKGVNVFLKLWEVGLSFGRGRMITITHLLCKCTGVNLKKMLIEILAFLSNVLKMNIIAAVVQQQQEQRRQLHFLPPPQSSSIRQILFSISTVLLKFWWAQCFHLFTHTVFNGRC